MSKITKKIEQLEDLLHQIEEAQVINSDDPETWDSDALYNLAEVCKEVLQLLEDKEHPTKKDPFGEPLVIEQGLLSLVDEYTSEKEEKENI